MFCLRDTCLLHAIPQCYLNNILTAQHTKFYWRVFTETEWDMSITQTACEVFVIPSMSDLLGSARLPRITWSEINARGCVRVNKTQMFLKKITLMSNSTCSFKYLYSTFTPSPPTKNSVWSAFCMKWLWAGVNSVPETHQYIKQWLRSGKK